MSRLRRKKLAESNKCRYIQFEDTDANSVLAPYCDTTGNGKISYREAAAATATNLKDAGLGNKLTQFNEFKYFTGITTIGTSEGIFNDTYDATSKITEVTFPPQLNSVFYFLGRGMFGSAFKKLTFTNPITVNYQMVSAALDAVYVPSLSVWLSCVFKDYNYIQGVNPLSYGGKLYIDGKEFDGILPDDITSLGAYQFAIPDLSSITLPSGLISLGNGCFKGCKNINNTELPSGITSIPKFCFDGCSNLAFSDISNVTEIGECAFRNCTNMTIPALSNNLTTLGTSCFQGVKLNITSLPDSLTTLGSSVFYNGNIALTSLPPSLNVIGGSCFCYCQGLSLTSLPSGLTTIGDRAFMGAKDVSGITEIPESVTSISEFVFYGAKIKKITIHSGVTTLANGLFYACGGIICKTEGEITSIGSECFANCGTCKLKLTPTTPPTLNPTRPFSGTTPSIYVPASAVDTYKAADVWSTYADYILPDTDWDDSWLD